MSYSLGERSQENLTETHNGVGVHSDLVRVVYGAIKETTQDFTVIDGMRTLSEQRKLVARGVSRSMNSRHLTGDAVDIIPYPIPRDWSRYTYSQWTEISRAMKLSAKRLGIRIEWGGDWRNGWDKPHYQLPRRNN